MTSQNVVIVIPPFASVDFPMIGPSLLATECRKRGHEASVFYGNILLASRLGYDLYTRISLSSFSVMLGDLLFRDLAFDEAFPVSIDEIVQQHPSIAVSTPQLLALSGPEINRTRSVLAAVVDEIVERVVSLEPSVVGLSSSFQQNLASIAIARRVKARANVATVLGGPNASRPMGDALLRTVDCFDFVFSGEADFAFPDFIDSLAKLKRDGVQRIVDCPPINRMDSVVVPAFHDYFQQLREFQTAGTLPHALPVSLPIESSRGCWWGAKHHCTFCGLNGEDIAFRSKSADRLVSEVESQEASYGVSSFQATDNIMPSGYVRTVLPRLAASGRARRLFYEVKSNLKGSDLDAFAAGGVTIIQPGIESFSSRLLKMIDKGVTGPHNVCLLRDCASRQIEVVWNMLVAIPGDEMEDYEAMLDLLPLVEHLHPPRGLSPIVIDRYSPYHSRPTAYGIESIEPLPAYRTLYPVGTALAEIAYHFRAKYRSGYLEERDRSTNFDRAVLEWQRKWGTDPIPPKLYAAALDDGQLFIEDTREIAQERWCILDRARAETLALFRDPKPAGLADNAHQDELIERGFLAKYEDHIFSIVVEPALGLSARKVV